MAQTTIDALSPPLLVLLVATLIHFAPEVDQPIGTDGPLSWKVPVGITILLQGDDPADRFGNNLTRATQLQATSIQITFPAFIERYDSSSLPVRDRRSPDAQMIASAISLARHRGFTVAVHPILLIQDASDSHWRGQLTPRNPSMWFRYYRDWIVPIAEICQREAATLLIVGSEFSSLQHHRDEWISTIAAVRDRFGGLVSYSSNWDRWQQVSFADHLDALGVNGYRPLVTTSTDEALVASWLPFRGQILHWQQGTGIPVFFSEVGYPSKTGALEEPWNHAAPGVADLEVQRRGYQAFSDTFRGDPSIGVYFYALYGDGGERDRSYTPAGKPAEQVIVEFVQERNEKTR